MKGDHLRNCRTCGSPKTAWRRRDGAGVGLRFVCTNCQNQRLRKRRAANKGYSTAKNKEWQKANPEKRAAHKAVERALRLGLLLKQPCVRCGSTDTVHAHHEDYARQLDVVWLCSTHHAERHREMEADLAA
ncbi:hypothetical protein ACQVP2_07625 [Methylobacterium aquaticum]|uniref:hypothetical protein n=1 Tax=Methylobacterium aquaticum TaxID=270351 RepID=UPI003D182F43